MPDSYPKDKGPSREYFFTVLNTVHPEYLEGIIKHANKVRHASDLPENQGFEIQMTNDWFNKLNEEPFVSRK